MATKKQQRRKYERAVGRGRLHEGYEPPERTGEEKPGQRRPARARGRTIEPPTLYGSGRRALIFAVIFSVGLDLIGAYKNATGVAIALQTVIFFFILWGTDYLARLLAWRRYEKKLRQSTDRG